MEVHSRSRTRSPYNFRGLEDAAKRLVAEREEAEQEEEERLLLDACFTIEEKLGLVAASDNEDDRMMFEACVAIESCLGPQKAVHLPFREAGQVLGLIHEFRPVFACIGFSPCF